MYERHTLAHADAMLIIEAIRTRAEAQGDGLAAAIVDEHGELLAFLRTDGCRLSSITIAQNKAYTAARERIETAELSRRVAEEGFPMTNYGELRYVSWDGGLPICQGENVIGAVGVSGLTGDEDVAYAEHGIAALLG